LVAVDGQLEPFESEFLSKGEVGCWKSHCKSMRKLVEKGAEFSLILEDDASLGHIVDEKFLYQMMSMMKRNQLDMLQIGYIEQFYSPSLRAGLLEFLLSLLSGRGIKDSSGVRFVLGDFRAGTHAYIVNARLAEAISSTVIYPPLIPWDGFLESLARGQMGRGDIRIARLVKSVVSQISRTSKSQKVDSDVGIK
jgi:GR25 family glycosyltransferase involved in LPS biosynthesis